MAPVVPGVDLLWDLPPQQWVLCDLKGQAQRVPGEEDKGQYPWPSAPASLRGPQALLCQPWPARAPTCPRLGQTQAQGTAEEAAEG